MSNKDIKAITKSIAEEVVQRSELIDLAKDLVKSEISHHNYLPENIARDMLEDVHNQLVPGIEETLI